MKYNYDFDPASHFTVGTVGKPGQRTFYIQAREGRTILTLLAEKEQARALAQALDRLGEEILTNNPLLSSNEDEVLIRDMSLIEPIEPAFRVVQMGLGYDADRDYCVMILQGMDDIPGGGKIVRAEVPLAEMFGYSTGLRSLTQGRATYTMEFKHYSEAPKNVAEAVMAAKSK
jgi:uncharacterized repeat protein (TIGR03847 family)